MATDDTQGPADRSDRAGAEPDPLPLGISTAVADWFLTAVPQASGPLRFDRIAGGRSNLTFAVVDAAGGRWILRRPPLGEHAATAHDVLREARLLRGLAGQVPVPTVLADCDDRAVSDAPLVVMEFLDGMVLRGPSDVRRLLPASDRAAVGPALVDTMVQLHRVDPARLGLGALAQRRDHLARQLRRWEGNWRRISTRPLPDLQRAHELLTARIPEQRRTAIVHGDFRLDNCLLGPDLAVHGLLDWELTTVGDPLADLGQFLVYWAEPDDEHTALYAPPTREPGFSTRAELAQRYCAATGDDPDSLAFYLAFNWWKTACILEDVYSRMRSGAMGTTDRPASSFGDQAEALAARAVQHAATLQ